jgi:hypothetical protein
MVTLDRIRLTGLLQESPANAGLSQFEDRVVLHGKLTMSTGMVAAPCADAPVSLTTSSMVLTPPQRDGEERSLAISAEDPDTSKPLANDEDWLEADDQTVAKCQSCGRSFDERAYQVIIWELGSFDSIECAESALRRRGRDSREEIAEALARAASHLQPHAQRAGSAPAWTEPS